MTKKSKIDFDDLWLAIIAVAVCVTAICVYFKANASSDAYIRDRVLQLRGSGGACTGIQVKAPSGMVYTLTAGHCKAILEEDETVTAIDEQGKSHTVFLVDIDEDKDLMLLSSTSYKSIDVAKKSYKHEHIRTITHGLMHDTYRTDGEILEEDDITMIKSRDPMCYLAIGLAQLTGQEIPQDVKDACIRTVHEEFTSAQVYPGSSGGPVLDDSGKLVGIVSITQEGTMFSGIIPLDSIHEFIKSR